MAAFDRENAVNRNRTLGIPARSNSSLGWIIGIVVIVGALCVYAYESGMWGPRDSATHETTQPVNPAPSPATKP
jgi:hypothetical protein